MALVKCVECDREVSDTRSDCPHCGAYREGQAPSQGEIVDPELMQIVQERKFKKKILETLKSVEFSKKLLTYKNGTMKNKRSIVFSYLHGEVASFNSYMDTDVDVTHTTISEVTGVTKSTYGYTADITTRSRNVVNDVFITKTKVTEIAVKHNNGEIKKYFFRGPEIDFLKLGDPITIGFLGIKWDKHTDDVADYEGYGLVHENGISPVMVISRAIDAHHKSNFVTDPSIFENDIFNEKLGRWSFTLLGAFILDLFQGTWPLFSLIGIAVLIFMKFNMIKGQKNRRKEYSLWWHEQANNAIKLAE